MKMYVCIYVWFNAQWLEHFSPDQFLIVRLEDYDADPKAYMVWRSLHFFLLSNTIQPFLIKYTDDGMIDAHIYFLGAGGTERLEYRAQKRALQPAPSQQGAHSSGL